MSDRDIFDDLTASVINGDPDEAAESAKKALSKGIDPLKAIDALNAGMARVGEDFSQLKCYLPQVMMAAEAMKAALTILEPAALGKGANAKSAKSKVVIATITGDIHDIGKNIVSVLLKANGFEVHDMGRDVAIDSIINKAVEVDADIIATSTLLSTSMPYMEDLLKLLEERSLRERFIVMVGGGPVTREWAESIGADGYADDGDGAVKKAQELISSSAHGGE